MEGLKGREATLRPARSCTFSIRLLHKRYGIDATKLNSSDRLKFAIYERKATVEGSAHCEGAPSEHGSESTACARVS